MTRFPSRNETVPMGFALAGGGAALLGTGALAAGSDGAAGPVTVLCLAALVVLAGGTVAEQRAVPPLLVISWLTVIGFSAPPYAQLRPIGTVSERAAVVLALAAVLGWAIGWLRHTPAPEPFTLRGVDEIGATTDAVPAAMPPVAVAQLLHAVDRRRQLAGLLLSAGSLPLITVGLTAARPHLTVTDTLLIYLCAVVGVTLVGGLWPAIASAAAASLLVNWYFTPPLHTLSINRAQDALALVLFVVIAVAISVVVHLAARRSADAARSRDEASVLLQLARTVLGGSDSPTDVLEHLVANFGGAATLCELSGGRRITVARTKTATETAETSMSIVVRPGLELQISPALRQTDHDARILSGFAAQAAAALDRQRLRAQASQAEMLAAGNTMRTALLAAVSHDLRTPLASVKAGVSSLRQTDVEWSPEDQAELLATIEESADRLDALIGNLLDMSRLSTGALQPVLRTTSVEEVAPAALRSLEGANAVGIELPDDLPLIRTDPGLLDRVLANLVSNALRFSPAGRPPTITAAASGDRVRISVIDHGPGVPLEARGRIFEPFQRLGDQSPSSGVGLGLAVAKGFMEAMGGDVTATETAGGGLTMTVSLRAETTIDRARPPAVQR